MKRMVCEVCGWVYDPAKGHAEANVPPNTAWDKVSSDFACPDCGAGKDSFVPE